MAWANQMPGGRLVTGVTEVPRGGRDMEPGFLERMERHRALQKVHGIRVSREALDDQFGTKDKEGRTKGTRGSYTTHLARRDLWHAKKHGGGWYEPMHMGDRVVFVSRYGGDQKRALIAEMAANTLRGWRR